MLIVCVGIFMGLLTLLMLCAPNDLPDGDEWRATEGAMVIGVSLMVFTVIAIMQHGVR